jgi:hypothetical protein
MNSSQINECMNWERGRAVSFLEIHKSDFRYSVQWPTPGILDEYIVSGHLARL